MAKEAKKSKKTLKKDSKNDVTKTASKNWFDYLRINYGAFDIKKTNR